MMSPFLNTAHTSGVLHSSCIENAVMIDGKPLSALAADNSFHVYPGATLRGPWAMLISPARFPALPRATIATPAIAEASSLRLRPCFIDSECSPA